MSKRPRYWAPRHMRCPRYYKPKPAPMKRLDPLAKKQLLPSERLGVPPTCPDVDLKVAAAGQAKHIKRITPLVAEIRNGTLLFMAQQEATKALLSSRSGVLPAGTPSAETLKKDLLAYWTAHPEFDDWRDAWAGMRGEGFSSRELNDDTQFTCPHCHCSNFVKTEGRHECSTCRKPSVVRFSKDARYGLEIVPGTVCAECGCDTTDPHKARHQSPCMSEKTVPAEPAHIAEMIRLRFKKKQADKALVSIKHFIGGSQLQAIRQAMRGEEGEWFMDRMLSLAVAIAGMPQTYEQDGLGAQAICHLHYFAGGSANWWITEKDKGSPDDEEQGVEPGQHQAFGLANMFGGPEDGELGYISIAEILANRGELDLHFEPRTIAKLKEEARPPKNPSPPPIGTIEDAVGDQLDAVKSKIIPFVLPATPLEEIDNLRMP